MHTNTIHHVIAIFTVSAAIMSFGSGGCGDPCGIISNGQRILAIECGEETTSETSGDTGDAETSGSVPTETTGSCVAGDVPNAGEIGGPCDAGACHPVDGIDVICADGPDGAVCLASCVDMDCPVVDGTECGMCRPDGLCAIECTLSDDCPFDGQVCDAGYCSWPKGDNDICGADAPAVGEAFGPCGDGCAPGLICIGGDVDGAVADLCTPNCASSAKCVSNLGACSACDSTGACIPPCAADEDCPFDGMVCDVIVPAFESRCLWPN